MKDRKKIYEKAYIQNYINSFNDFLKCTLKYI